MTAMQTCPKRFRLIAWTFVSIGLATVCALILWRIRAYEREGTLMAIQSEIEGTERAWRHYQAAADTLRQAARRAGVQTQQAVVTMVRGLERRRDETRVQGFEAQVTDFYASDIEILTNFTDFVQATNVMRRLARAVMIEAHVRAGGGRRNDGTPTSYHLLVRKSDASRAREALPGVLTTIRETKSDD
jgi:hypothetical protein